MNVVPLNPIGEICIAKVFEVILNNDRRKILSLRTKVFHDRVRRNQLADSVTHKPAEIDKRSDIPNLLALHNIFQHYGVINALDIVLYLLRMFQTDKPQIRQAAP